MLPRRRKKTRKKGQKQRPGFLKSAEKTLDVLELLAKRDSVGVTELAKAKKIGISTAHRILSTLKKRGFVVQDQGTRRYRLGGKLKRLSR